jgi:hypothetical protein
MQHFDRIMLLNLPNEHWSRQDSSHELEWFSSSFAAPPYFSLRTCPSETAYSKRWRCSHLAQVGDGAGTVNQRQLPSDVLRDALFSHCVHHPVQAADLPSIFLVKPSWDAFAILVGAVKFERCVNSAELERLVSQLLRLLKLEIKLPQPKYYDRFRSPSTEPIQSWMCSHPT